MPFIVVYMYDDLYAARSDADKDALVAAPSDAMERHGGVTPGSTQVIIQGTPRENWAINRRRGTTPGAPKAP